MNELDENGGATLDKVKRAFTSFFTWTGIGVITLPVTDWLYSRPLPTKIFKKIFGTKHFDFDRKMGTARDYKLNLIAAIGAGAIAGIFSFFSKKESNTLAPQLVLQSNSPEEPTSPSPEFTRKLLDERQTKPESALQK